MSVLDKNDLALLHGDLSCGLVNVIYARREDDGTIYATIRPKDYVSPSDREKAEHRDRCLAMRPKGQGGRPVHTGKPQTDVKELVKELTVRQLSEGGCDVL